MKFESEYQLMRIRYMQVREPGTGEYTCRPVVPERLVRCLWYDGLYRRDALRTDDGQPVQVLSQGEWNLQDGPDFLGSVVRIGNGAPVQGDVEIHVRAGDWRRHGHHQNPRFNRVVLHVSLWRDNGDTTAEREDGTPIPQAALIQALDEDIENLAIRIDMENYPFCSDSRVGACHLAACRHPETAERVLRLAGRERLINKARRCARELTRFNEDEVIYHGFMEGMGYRPNKKPFRKLAQLVPLKKLQPLLLATPPEERALVLQSVFLGASGLFDHIPVELWDTDSVEYFKKLRACWDREDNPFASVKRMSKSEWTLRGVRPANFPSRRIVGISQYLAGTGGLPGRPVHAFARMLLGAKDDRLRRAAVESLVAVIIQDSRGFWEHRLCVGSEAQPAVPALIGRTLARTLILNTVLPVLLCRARRDRDGDLTQAVFSLYDDFRCLDIHQISRLMRHRVWGLSEDPPPLRHEAIQQGLLQIFFDFCDENIKDCGRCTLPDMIRDQAEAARG